MFQRRRKPSLSSKINNLFWPSMGWKRMLRYYSLRIVRLSAAPEPLARAIACGVTVSFFPVFGIHALLGIGMAILMRANVVASALATLIVPPVILPLIFSLDFLVGRKILRWLGYEGQGSEASFAAQAVEGTHYALEKFDTYFLPALLGACVFMILVWPATYMAAHKLIAVLAHRHRNDKERRKTS